VTLPSIQFEGNAVSLPLVVTCSGKKRQNAIVNTGFISLQIGEQWRVFVDTVLIQLSDGHILTKAPLFMYLITLHYSGTASVV
jgi:hypothetical protein